jgi:hypothetical protein
LRTQLSGNGQVVLSSSESITEVGELMVLT